ncbi:MAG: hypothetical protein ACRCU5_16710 [Rhizobiaceae bacterium]
MRNPQPIEDGFSFRPLTIFGFWYLAAAVLGAIFNNSAFIALCASISIVFAALLVAALFKQRWRRASSFLLAFPGVFAFAYAIGSMGIDRYQLAFWATYPYYQFQVHYGQAKEFNWSEDGVFLGGGWQNTLVYDPDNTIWSDAARKSSVQKNLIGFEVLTDPRNSTVEDCDMRLLRQLGGSWYLETQYYGGGFICK